MTEKFIDGLGWALVDDCGNVIDLLENSEQPIIETDNDYDIQARQAEFDIAHGYIG